MLIKEANLLRKESIYYGNYAYTNVFDSYSHHNLLWAIADETYAFWGIPPLYKIPETAEAIVGKMVRNAANSRCETILLSCELFFYTIFDTHLKIKGVKVTNEQITRAFGYCVNRFKSLFPDFEIKIICYLRRQDLFIESLFNQFVKESSPDFFKTVNGENVNLLDTLNYSFKDDSKVSGFNRVFRALFNYTDYYAILNEWASAYGRENVIVRPFEKSQLEDGIVQDFFKNALCIEFNINGGDTRINPGVGRDKLEYLLRLQMRGFHSRILNIPETAEFHKTDNLYMSLAERNALMLFHKKGNEAVARDFLNRENGVLFYEEVKQEEDTYTGLSEKMTFNITRGLLAAVNK